MIDSQTQEPVLAVLRKHFPEQRMLQIPSAELHWNDVTFTRDTEFHGINHDQQIQHLRDLKNGLRAAAKAYAALAPSIRKQLEANHKRNVLDRKAVAPRLATADCVNGIDGERKVLLSARDLIERLHVGVLGKWPFDLPPKIKQADAVASTIQYAKTVDTETHQQQRSGTWKKAILTARAREVWEEFGGTEAPSRKLNAFSPFAYFLSDLIEALGEDWKPVPTFNAWRRLVDS